MMPKQIEPVALDDAGSALVIVDQTLIPNETRYLRLTTPEETWEAIRSLRVRGAPAIGIAAAMGLYLGVKGSEAADFEDFYHEFRQVKAYLASARPTAVNLFWALDRMEAWLLRHRDRPIPEIKEALRAEAEAIREEDARANRTIGEYALSLLKPGMGILTHCNAGGAGHGRLRHGAGA